MPAMSPAAALVLSVTALAALSLIISTLRLGIGPVPTSRPVRALMLSLVPPETSGLIYELGSGWGGLARALARHCPGAQVVAIEGSFLPWAFSRLVHALAPLPNLELRRANFFEVPLEPAAVAVCYLFTGAMQRLAQRLPAATTVVTSTFALPGRTATQTLRADDLYRTPIYRYGGQ
jgi:hypothetical protein